MIATMVSRSRALRTLRMHESPDVFFHKKLPSRLVSPSPLLLLMCPLPLVVLFCIIDTRPD